MTRTALLALALVALVSVADAATRRDTHARMPAAPSPGADAYLGFADASHGDQLLVRAVLEEPENGAQLHDVETGACRAAGFANVTERARAVLRQK